MRSFLALGANVAVVLAASTPTTKEASKSDTVEPCAQVSSLWAAQIGATATPTVAASLAHACLNTIPLHKEPGIELIDALEPYLKWQSDSAYLADPPADYFYPPHDIFKALAGVRADLVADKYTNEYEFQEDLYARVWGPAHDGHFVFYPDALTIAFEWTRPKPIVSISENGKDLPVIKLYEDVIRDPKTAPVITKINGVEASKFVLDTVTTASFNQDADAAYNSMFYSKGFTAASGGSKGYFSSGGRVRYIYQGPNTTFTFDNGTSATFENTASVKANFTGIVDGPSYFSTLCVLTIDGEPREEPLAAISAGAQSGQVPGYPAPVLATDDGTVSGYFLEGEGFDDVAVLSLLSFEPSSAIQFQAVIQNFFAEAVTAGKTKLVIDFQGNGGGLIGLGYDLYGQLFPHIRADGFSRWKLSPEFETMAHVYSNASKHVNPYTDNRFLEIEAYLTELNWRFDLNEKEKPFTSFADKFAPRVFKDTPYTALTRWNWSDPLISTNTTFGFGLEISGYGTRANLSQPFLPENIVLLYDGACASTCTIASESLRLNGGVKSVAFGGRPQKGPIQGVGGVKGSQIYQLTDVFVLAEDGTFLGTNAANEAVLQNVSSLPIARSTAGSMNVRDQIIRTNLEDGLPAQFVVEHADCRLYWTAPMVTDITEVWKAAAGAAFNNAKCANGGIKYKAPKAHVQPTTNPKLPMINENPKTGDSQRSGLWNAKYRLRTIA
ncbi:hypothetical protein TGAMA5MH_05989 [Trichoderma gamsii]|uniref:CPAF-like PDZ domain-containing protein n=1 Tax=Trichoderma gamsii TaxID=398673 RepID=A0A2K0T9V1_9HYPO|nr:hypothetical protein TGAMA5MH_05989 [Trichoderma gamsii]